MWLDIIAPVFYQKRILLSSLWNDEMLVLLYIDIEIYISMRAIQHLVKCMQLTNEQLMFKCRC